MEAAVQVRKLGEYDGRRAGVHYVAWNTGGMRADLGIVRDGRWNLLDVEARRERRASQRKIEWLREHVYTSEPTVVFLEEVTGSLQDAKKGDSA